MEGLKTRKCHKCKHTLKSKNFVTLKNGNPVCDVHKKGIPEDIFFKGKSCKKFELARKYNISEMIGNLLKKFKNEKSKEIKSKTKIQTSKSSVVIPINKNIN